MMQRWSEDTVRFMRDASHYGSYHRELATALLPYLPTDGKVCDAGCGLGDLSLELAKYCREVTAVDASPAALQGLIEGEKPKNLRVVQGDIFTLNEEFDAMVFCYFGKTEEILSLACQKCRGNVIVVRRDCSRHRFSAAPVERKEHSINFLTQRLQELAVPYLSKSLALELGQPFRSFEDALCFFELYNKSDRPVSPEELKNKLLPVEHGEFCLYYPNVREMELIVFSSKNIKNTEKYR